MIDGDEEEGGIFEVEDEIFVNAADTDTPPHLRGLLLACERGNPEALLEALANLNGNIDEPVEDGDTALHLSCLYGHFSCVQLLLERGASLEMKDEDGAIPLHDACAGGFIEIVRLLLEKANDPDCVKRMLETVDVEGDTPLHHAARGEYVDVIRLLLASGASPTKRNIYGKLPSEVADAGSEARRVLEEAEGSTD